jgi:ATP-dependent exoDNAse (exonuclease V) beta subunit
VLRLINSDDEIIRVEAGPGTGKTFGLVRRVQRILHPDGLGVPGSEKYKDIRKTEQALALHEAAAKALGRAGRRRGIARKRQDRGAPTFRRGE